MTGGFLQLTFLPLSSPFEVGISRKVLSREKLKFLRLWSNFRVRDDLLAPIHRILPEITTSVLTIDQQPLTIDNSYVLKS